jgi:hypothetical protein
VRGSATRVDGWLESSADGCCQARSTLVPRSDDPGPARERSRQMSVDRQDRGDPMQLGSHHLDVADRPEHGADS